MKHTHNSFDEDPLEPELPRYRLKTLLWYLTGACVLLAIASLTVPELLGPNAKSMLLIVAFATYPFAVGIAADYLCKTAHSNRLARLLATLMGFIGLAPAILINYPRPLVPMVGPIAGVVLILCFASTGALLGALLDMRKRFKSG